MTPKKLGRPTVFTPEVLEKVLKKISEGATERSIFFEEDMPEWSTWTKYKRQHPDFIPQYLRAKEDQCEVWEHECKRVAYDESRDLMPDGKGGFKSDNTAVNRDRLKVDTMWRLMRSTMPRKYGDKVQQEITGAEGAPLIPQLNIIVKK